MIIGIDFDGTSVTHEYPKIGKDIGAIPVLKDLVAKGHKLILYTMRSGRELDDAVQWFTKNNISLYSVNHNPNQHLWTSSPKVYCNLYIDDAALGIPLINTNQSDRPYVDWSAVRYLLLQARVL